MPEALPSVPSFSEQQVHGHDLINIIHSVMQQYFAPQNPLLTPPLSNQPSSTPVAPQGAQKEEDIQLSQQATVENTTKHGCRMPDSKSTLSTIPRLCTVRSSGDSAACLSNFACQHIMFLNTLLGYTLPRYIGHSEELEATGQG